MTVELLPCSKCRRVPEWSAVGWWECDACDRVAHSADSWNHYHGSPLTLAERPQDVPALNVEELVDNILRTGEPHGFEDEPSVGDGVRVVPTAASCVERGRSCEDALARWSVGACSGGVT